METIKNTPFFRCQTADELTLDIKLNFKKMSKGNHYIGKVGCEAFVAHSFKDARTELMQLFKQHCKDFFSEDNKKT